MDIKIYAESISKKFDNRTIFKNITITLSAGSILCIKGPNGSGKSTLIKILSGHLKPSSGSLRFMNDDTLIRNEDFFHHYGFLGPYIQPYNELTCIENIRFVLRKKLSGKDIDSYLDHFGLLSHKNIYVRNLSTGLQQRLKYVVSTINEPPIQFLDEPGSNLDRSAKKIIYDHILSFNKKRIIVIATNDVKEEQLCNEVLSLAS